jgi:hypothetical protein
MNIQKYAEKKQKGMVEVLSVGKAHALVSKRFDPETGAELDPEIVALNKEELTKQREQLAKALASIDALLADMDKPKTPAK